MSYIDKYGERDHDLTKNTDLLIKLKVLCAWFIWFHFIETCFTAISLFWTYKITAENDTKKLPCNIITNVYNIDVYLYLFQKVNALIIWQYPLILLLFKIKK